MYSPTVSVIILNWNGGEMLNNCIESLLASDYGKLEIIISDNGSTDGSDSFVEKHYPSIKLLRNGKNLGYSQGNNVALPLTKGDIIIFSNNDITVRKDTISKLVKVFDNPKVGIATGVLCHPKSFIAQNAGFLLHKSGYIIPCMVLRDISRMGIAKTLEVDAVQGAFMAVKRSMLRRIGLFDQNLWSFYEDIEICTRAKQVYAQVVVRLDCIIWHKRSGSWQRTFRLQMTKSALREKGRLYFLVKHYRLRNVLISITWHELCFWVRMLVKLLQRKTETQLTKLILQEGDRSIKNFNLARMLSIWFFGKITSLFYLPSLIKSSANRQQEFKEMEIEDLSYNATSVGIKDDL